MSYDQYFLGWAALLLVPLVLLFVFEEAFAVDIRSSLRMVSFVVAVFLYCLAHLSRAEKYGLDACNNHPRNVLATIDSKEYLMVGNFKDFFILRPYDAPRNQAVDPYELKLVDKQNQARFRVVVDKDDKPVKIQVPECKQPRSQKSAADGYFLSCTATSMIDAIKDVERSLDKPVVNSNQAVLWAALRRLEITEPIAGFGRLFSSERRA